MEVRFDVDSSGVSKLASNVARMIGQYEWIVAGAMTDAAKQAKADVASQILPRIQGGATAWTRRGLIVSYAKPKRLYSVIGFNYGDGSFEELGFGSKVSGGVPSGRYMQMQAGGGARQPKSTERKLRASGIIPGNAFITPSGAKPLKLNGAGNLSGPMYTQMLSRLGAASTMGSSQNKTGSKRSTRKQADRSYFVATINGHLGIHVRTGKAGKQGGKPRGFSTVFYVTKQPKYKATLPIRQVALAGYERTFAASFRKRLDYELTRRA
jgi:hypothetical protein